MAGRSLRRVRSPVAPKSTSAAGLVQRAVSTVGHQSRPSPRASDPLLIARALPGGLDAMPAELVPQGRDEPHRKRVVLP